MSVNYPSLFAQQFSMNVEMKLQQKGSRLRACVTEDSYKGEQASPVDQIDSVEMISPAGRFAPIGRVDADVDRRWVSPEDFELPQLVDSFDKLKLLSDPMSKYVTNAVYAAGRKIDLKLLRAMTGTNYTGKSGTTATVLPSAQKVAVNFGAAGNTGLTVAKLIDARRILMASDVEEDEPLFCAIKAKQHANLLNEIQVISKDFNEKPVLVKGKITEFLGFTFIHTELVETSTYDLVPCWAKSGVHLGMWDGIYTDVSQRKDLSSHPWQAYVKISVGATRLEEEKVVQISCA